VSGRCQGGSLPGPLPTHNRGHPEYFRREVSADGATAGNRACSRGSNLVKPRTSSHFREMPEL